MATNREVSAGERARRRRAVYGGLRPFLTEAQVLEALLLWETRFAGGPVYALHGFVSTVCTMAALDARHGEIYRSLMRALTMDEDQLPPDPGVALERYARARAPDAAPATAAPLAGARGRDRVRQRERAAARRPGAAGRGEGHQGTGGCDGAPEHLASRPGNNYRRAST